MKVLTADALETLAVKKGEVIQVWCSCGCGIGWELTVPEDALLKHAYVPGHRRKAV